VKQRTALGTLLLVLVSSSLAVAQDLGEDLEGELEPEQDEPPADPPAEEPAPDVPVEEPPAEPVEEAADEPGAEGEVGAGVEIGADAAAVEGELAAEATPPEPPSSAGSEIVVTGSRIKRSTAFAPSAPVEVIDRKQLEYSGATNLADVVQYMTVAQGSGSQGQTGAAGTVSINLRGLGEGATLVLINGRRTNPSGGGISTTFGDLGVIPLAAVERIEILKGGASALYGADAVGGVVNVITRKNFDGVRVELDGQTTQDFEQKDGTASAAFGATSERSRVLVATSYFRRTELTSEKRDFTDGYYISTQGQPAAYAPVSPTGMIIGLPMADPACATVPGSMVAPGSTGAGEVCAFDYRRFTSLLGNGERANAFGSAEYDLTNHTTIFGELTTSRLRGDGVFSPSLPFPPPFPTIPADHIDNTFGSDQAFIGRPLGAQAGETRNPVADDTFRGVIGLKGDFEGAAEDTLFESWEWELFATWGISRYRYTFDDNLRDPFLEAINSCSDPSDLSGCFNPFYSAINGTGTPNSQEVIDSFSGEMMVMNDHALQTYNAGLAGSLFELPGGEIGIALGGEVRHEWRTSELEHDANEDRYAFFVGNPDASVARDVYSAYLELRLPFFDGVELQGAARVERYTDTDSTPISPGAGLTLVPSEMIGRDNTPDAFRRLQLRGHLASAFRAPTIFQSFPGFATIPTPLRLGGPLPTYIPVRSFGNPNLEPETALAVSGGIVWSPVEPIALALDLWHYDYKDRIDREDAQQIINIDLARRSMMQPGDERVVRDPLSDSVERVNVQQINVAGSTVTNGIDFGLMFTLDGGDFGGAEEDWGTLRFGGQGTYTHTFDIPRGQSSQRMVGATTFLPPADCEGSSAVDEDADLSNDAQNDEDACHVAGKRNANNFAPAIAQWRVNFPLIWTISGHSATAIAHYISGLEDDVTPNMDGSFDQIEAFTTFDLQYGYTLTDVIGEELALRIGVYNVLDTYPPHVNGSATALEAGVHDPRGRMFYAKLASQF
jgi:iron complex outermembrane recepter protein